jgi:hypothetical protein
VALPILLIVGLNARFPILTTRNFLLVTPAIALLIGHGITNLDRTARTFVLTVLIVVSLFTVDAYLLKPPWRTVAEDILQYREGAEPVLMDVWVDDLALRYHIGRDLKADPASLPLLSMPEWREKYGVNFFAYLLQYLSDKDSFWLAYWGKNEDKLLDFFVDHGFTQTSARFELHRDEKIFVYRYERVGAQEITRFGDVFALKRANLNQQRAAPGDMLRLNLLWQALKAPPVDYSFSTFVLNEAGQLVAQRDEAPMQSNTASWTPGAALFDSHSVTLPTTLAPGRYTVGFKIYWYVDLRPLPVLGSPTPDYYVVGTIEVQPAAP